MHDIEGMNNSLLDDGKSSTTVRQVHNNVGTCLKAAYKRGLIAKDICSLVDAPKSLKRKPIILNRVQWKQLIESTRATARELIIEFTLKTGMRINEVLDTTWSQVDTEAGTVTVGESKTDAGSGRTIPLDKLLVRRLTTLRAEHYAIQMQHREWNHKEFVFVTSKGNREEYTNLQRWVLTPLLKELGLPHLTWHHLRHNAGSYLLSENVPITAVSKILGHANPAITMGIYAHELREDLEQVRVAMAKFA
jgi:integrase